MSVVLDLDVRVFLLYVVDKPAEGRRPADAGHVLEAYLICSIGDYLVDDVHIVLDGVDRRVCDGEGDLGNHPAFLRELYRTPEVAVVVETAEGPRDVGALLFLDLEHEFPDIGRDRVHSEGIEASLKHVGLDACLMERGCPSADSRVRVFSEEEVDLLEGSSIGLDPVETAHVDDCRGDFFQLVDTWDVLAGRLPHVAVN